jgi:hypothetical protein
LEAYQEALKIKLKKAEIPYEAGITLGVPVNFCSYPLRLFCKERY